MAISTSQNHHIDSYKKILEVSYFDEILKSIREKKFSRKDIAVTPREINHWASKNFLYEDYEGSKWKKFSIVDIIWIQLIIELRKYEVPLSVLFQIKKKLKGDLNLATIFDTYGEEVFEVATAAISQELKDEIKMEDLRIALDTITNKDKPKDIFELIVMETYLLKYQNRFVVNFDGMCLFYSELYYEDYLASEEYKLHFEKSNISLSVNALISSVFKDYIVSDLALNWKLISSDEVKILEIIQQQKNIKSINIRYNEKSEVSLLEIVEEIQMTPQDYLKKIIVEGSYLDIRIITQNGKIVLCEKTTKQKL